SLARPGGNVTGLSLFLGEEFSSKWLELLREVISRVLRVAVLLNRASPASVGYLAGLQGAAQKLGIKLLPQAVRYLSQFEGAFAAMVAERAQGLVVVVDPLTVRYRGRIVELAAKNRIPAVYGFREFVDAGVSWPTGSMFPTCVDAQPGTWTRSLRAPSLATSPSSSQLRSSWSSTSRPPRPSG